MVGSSARRAASVVEPLSACVYFAPEPVEEYAAIGVEGPAGYFLSRSAAMGRATPATVAAAFFVFNPRLVGRFLRWEQADPAAVIGARERGAARAGARLLAADDGALPDLERPLELLRRAVAACRPEGRALFAAHARLPWPEDPVAALWHGANLLREYRGDGHIAVLLTHDVGAVEALVLAAAYKHADPAFYHQTRGWEASDYEVAARALAARGFLTDDGALTDGGGKFREMIEMETDHLAAPPFAALGAEADELIALLEPLARRVVDRRAIPASVVSLSATSRLISH